MAATVSQAVYADGLAALNRGDYASAVQIFAAMGPQASSALAYAQGMLALQTETYDEATREFMAAGDFEDATQRVQDARLFSAEQQAYWAGDRAFAGGDLIEAIRKFAAAGDYRDAITRLSQAQNEQTTLMRYGDAQALLQQRKYAEAYEILVEIDRDHPNYRDVPVILSHLTADVLPVTVDLAAFADAKDVPTLVVPVRNLIGTPIGYLRAVPLFIQGAIGAPAVIGSVRIEFVSRNEPNASRLNAVAPVFIAADEPILHDGVRGGDQAVVATSGIKWQGTGFGAYAATITVRESTLRAEGTTLIDGQRTRATTFRTCVLEVALRR